MTAATTRDALREMIADTREVFSADGPETPQIVRDVIEYVNSWMTIYLDKLERRFPVTPAAATGADAEPVAKGADEAVALNRDHHGPWSVINSAGACIIEGVPLAIAADFMTDDRMVRGWTMVCVVSNRAALDELASDRAAALERDAERLDWIERQWFFAPTYSPGSIEFIFNETWSAPGGSLREAIDAAMKGV